MPNERLAFLFDKYINGNCTTVEKKELAVLALASQHDADVQELLQQYWDQVTAEVKMPEDKAASIAAEIIKQHPINQPLQTGKVKRINWVKWVAAASVLLLISIGGYKLFLAKPVKQGGPGTTLITDVKPPASNRAMITLADGRKLYLDSVANGTMATQENVKLVKLADGQIAYNGAAGKVVYNTLTNPRGSKVVDMTLSDGTHVWLNTGSSITYPVSFIGNERKVSITGEAYFEVTHDVTKPFYVTKDDLQVQVLGTHFNVNAYDDESDTRISLLQGSVEINSTDASLRIKPGEQAVVTSNGAMALNKQVDMDMVMAWKNGLFSFDNADLPAVMKQLSRWYDIEVTFSGKIPEGKFKGKIPRDLTLSQLLNGLSSTRIHFTMEGNKITILPQ